jgi:hypothetical protein
MKPQVKPSELTRILQTKDYSIFNLKDFKISKRHLNVVKESIQEKNLSKDYPILVDKNYDVIEGKYRFLALYELGLPIHYKISEVTSIEDAIRIKHIHKNVPLEDCIKVYSSIKQYKDLILLQDEFDFSYRTIVLVAQIDPSRTHTINRKSFDSGRLPEFDFDKAKEKLSRIKFICDAYQWDERSSLSVVDSEFPTIQSIIDASFFFKAAVKLYTKMYGVGRERYYYCYDLDSYSGCFYGIQNALNYTSKNEIKATTDEYPELLIASEMILKQIGIRIKTQA